VIEGTADGQAAPVEDVENTDREDGRIRRLGVYWRSM